MRASFFALLTALMFNSIVGASIASLLGFDPMIGVVVSNGIGLVPRAEGSLMAGLNKEIWIAEIMEKFFPDWSFVKESRDMTEFVEYNTLNLAEAGIDPDVLVNNTVWPIPFAQRADVPLDLPLDTYDTENTLVRNVEEMETSYNKTQSVTAGHKNALLNTFSKKAAHAWAPDSDGAFTPVRATTGAAAGTFKAMTLDDIDAMGTAFDLIDAPDSDRILVLHPTHFEQLRKQDRSLFKSFIGQRSGGFDLLGFKVYKFRNTAIFNKTTGAKVAYGAAAAPTTDTISSLAYLKNEVVRAQGTMDMFADLKSPHERGDIIGFQMRALALPARSKYIASIYSAAV